MKSTTSKSNRRSKLYTLIAALAVIAIVVAAGVVYGVYRWSSTSSGSNASTAVTSTHTPTPSQESAPVSPSASKDVILIAFQTNWRSVAAECTKTYGPEGVGYVEVSPPQESIQGSQWWTSYQPASYRLDSKLGSESDFTNMVSTCKAAGVGIIADAVINHMAGAYSGGGERQGVSGSPYTADGSFPAVPYSKENFHTCTSNIMNYGNASDVQNCRLDALQDLDTSQPYVQDKISDYLKHLLDLGVYGFRVDAVKHIANADVAAIKTRLAQKTGRPAQDIFFEQEVIGSPSEAKEIQPSVYLGNGKVSEFRYSSSLAKMFADDIADEDTGLKSIGGKYWLPTSKAAVWVTNWDTERDRALTYKSGPSYLLANAFMLAYDYGQPHVYSGYYFATKDDGAPGATATSVPDASCPTDGSMQPGTWQCAQRWTAIRGMIGFRKAVSGQKVRDWKRYGQNVLGFSRGSAGYLALNNSSKPSQQTFRSSLPAGEYCNVYASGDCSQTIKVSRDGSFQATLPAHSAIALHTSASKSTWKGTQSSDPSDPRLG
ncbi:hypothetical protein KIM372_15620 [Bombiscardovia nodaiensis]|uniref:Alpha-amylase n=1 Tax=Bombiscardovia nodaiensis TaxID=2932181 RepID=A0ABM8BA69_9BIFI|nr:hypothetical protein KIM372_15620 [Bombiscardovia nodaiensis]